MQRAGWKQRSLGAALALAVQAVFVLLVLLSPHSPRPASLPRETILLFPPLALPTPTTIDARGPRRKRSIVPAVTPVSPPVVPPAAAAPPVTPPSGLAGFGRSLFGCRPENYASLTPEERSHCPKPGEGLARNNDRELVTGPRSPAKDEAMWQEKWYEDHDAPAPCLPTPAGIAVCLLGQSIAENRRREAAWEKIAAERAARDKAKPPPLPDSRQGQTAK